MNQVNPSVSIFTGNYDSVIDPTVVQILELPQVINNRIVSFGYEPEIHANAYARVVILDYKDESWNWLQRDLPFWESIFTFDFEMIRTAGWRNLGCERLNNGRILSNAFVPCDRNEVLRCISEEPESAVFHFELLGGNISANSFRTYSKFIGSSTVFHFSYPFIIGGDEWVKEVINQVESFYKDKHYDFSVFKKEADFDQIVKSLLYP